MWSLLGAVNEWFAWLWAQALSLGEGFMTLLTAALDFFGAGAAGGILSDKLVEAAGVIAPYVGYANAYVPLDVFVLCLGLITVVWGQLTLVRITKKLIPMLFPG